MRHDDVTGGFGGTVFRMPPPDEAERCREREARPGRAPETARVGWAVAGVGAAWLAAMLGTTDALALAQYPSWTAALVFFWKALLPDRVL